MLEEDKQELFHEGSTIILNKFDDLFEDMFQRVSTEEQKVDFARASAVGRILVVRQYRNGTLSMLWVACSELKWPSPPRQQIIIHDQSDFSLWFQSDFSII